MFENTFPVRDSRLSPPTTWISPVDLSSCAATKWRREKERVFYLTIITNNLHNFLAARCAAIA